jgi:hypothetical protein
VSLWCTNWWWMDAWWIMVTLNTFFTTFCNSPFDRVWRIKATAIPGTAYSTLTVGYNTGSSSIELNDFPNTSKTPRSQATSANLESDTDSNILLEAGPPNSETRLSIQNLMVNVQGSNKVGTSLAWLRSFARRQKQGRYNNTTAVNTKGDNQFCILVTVRGISNMKFVLRQISRITTGAVFLYATTWLASVNLLPVNIAVMITTVIGASALLARFGAEALIKIVNQLDACVHFPVVSDANAAELVYSIATNVPGIMLEVGNLKIVNGRVYQRSRLAELRWNIFGLLL